MNINYYEIQLETKHLNYIIFYFKISPIKN